MMISENFEDFSHALRRNLENYLRAEELFKIDKDEAIGNFELGMTNILSTFHSLYDACKADSDINREWYLEPELLMILAIRNAKHHNLVNKVRSFF